MGWLHEPRAWHWVQRRLLAWFMRQKRLRIMDYDLVSGAILAAISNWCQPMPTVIRLPHLLIVPEENLLPILYSKAHIWQFPSPDLNCE